MSMQPDLQDLFVDRTDWLLVARDVTGGALLAAGQPAPPLPGAQDDGADHQAGASGPPGEHRPTLALQGDGGAHTGHNPSGQAISFGEPSAVLRPDPTDGETGSPAWHVIAEARPVGQPAGPATGHDGPVAPGPGGGQGGRVSPLPAAAKAPAHPPGSLRPPPAATDHQADGTHGPDNAGGTGGAFLQIARTSTTTLDSHMSLSGQLTHDAEAGLWTMSVSGFASVSTVFDSSWVLQTVHGDGGATVLDSQAWSARFAAEVSFQAETHWHDGEDVGAAMVLAQSVPLAAWVDILPDSAVPGLPWTEDRHPGSGVPSIASLLGEASGEVGFAQAHLVGDLGASGILLPLSLIG